MNPLDFEEEFHKGARKESRKERREAQIKDRSKFKRSDQAKIPAQKDYSHLERGRILSITGEGSIVAVGGKKYTGNLKGILKKDKGLFKNIVAVGDFVYVSILSENEVSITQVEPRTSSLSRTDISGKKEQLIATNIDYAIICCSILEPTLKPSLIDRYLIAAKKGKLLPIIVINKIDLLQESLEEKNLYKEFVKVYEALGYEIFSVSTETKKGIAALREKLKNKTSVFSGQSGVGKSSLLNVCFKLTLKTGELTAKTAKGAHTTTRAELIELPEGGYCVDTPGIRSFGIWKLTKEDVIEHFEELKILSEGCKYPNCMHISEPNCKVKEAIEHKKISPLRFESYYNLLEDARAESVKTTWN